MWFNYLVILIAAFGLTQKANQSQIYVQLNDGRSMPILGLGTWKSKSDDAYQAVKSAIEIGYRHIDTALAYRNEKEVGNAIRDMIGNGTVKREELFVVSKVWNSFHSRENALKGVNISLTNLGLDYIDLMLIHWPFGYKEGEDLKPLDQNNNTIFSDIDYLETWSALEEAKQNGLVKSIGVSNFNSSQLKRVINNGTIKPVVNQIECHPFLTQEKLIEFCKNHSVAVTAYGPLGHGKLLNNTKINSFAEKYNKSAAQILIRYQIERGIIVIPKSKNRTHIEENFNVFGFKLSPEDMQNISSMNKNTKYVKVVDAKNHKYYPFNEPLNDF